MTLTFFLSLNLNAFKKMMLFSSSPLIFFFFYNLSSQMNLSFPGKNLERDRGYNAKKIEIVGGVEGKMKAVESCLMIKKKGKRESKRGQKRRRRFLFLGGDLFCLVLAHQIRPTLIVSPPIFLVPFS